MRYPTKALTLTARLAAVFITFTTSSWARENETQTGQPQASNDILLQQKIRLIRVSNVRVLCLLASLSKQLNFDLGYGMVPREGHTTVDMDALVSIDLRNTTLKEVLNTIVVQAPHLRWRQASAHFIDFSPALTVAKGDLLEEKIKEFKVFAVGPVDAFMKALRPVLDLNKNIEWDVSLPRVGTDAFGENYLIAMERQQTKGRDIINSIASKARCSWVTTYGNTGKKLSFVIGSHLNYPLPPDALVVARVETESAPRYSSPSFPILQRKLTLFQADKATSIEAIRALCSAVDLSYIIEAPATTPKKKDAQDAAFPQFATDRPLDLRLENVTVDEVISDVIRSTWAWTRESTNSGIWLAPRGAEHDETLFSAQPLAAIRLPDTTIPTAFENLAARIAKATSREVEVKIQGQWRDEEGDPIVMRFNLPAMDVRTTLDMFLLRTKASLIVRPLEEPRKGIEMELIALKEDRISPKITVQLAR